VLAGFEGVQRVRRVKFCGAGDKDNVGTGGGYTFVVSESVKDAVFGNVNLFGELFFSKRRHRLRPATGNNRRQQRV
jgi:hypothetical protein